MKKNCRRSLNWTEFAALLFHIIIVYLKPQGLFNHTEHKACTSYSIVMDFHFARSACYGKKLRKINGNGRGYLKYLFSKTKY